MQIVSVLDEDGMDDDEVIQQSDEEDDDEDVDEENNQNAEKMDSGDDRSMFKMLISGIFCSAFFSVEEAFINVYVFIR